MSRLRLIATVIFLTSFSSTATVTVQVNHPPTVVLQPITTGALPDAVALDWSGSGNDSRDDPGCRNNTYDLSVTEPDGTTIVTRNGLAQTGRTKPPPFSASLWKCCEKS